MPPVIRSQAEKRLSAALGRPVKIRQVRCNPLTLSLEITGLHVGDGQGGEFVGWQRLFVNFDPLKRLTGAWTFKEIILEGLNLAVLRDASGRMNFADLIEKSQRSNSPRNKNPSRPPALAIERLEVNAARMQFNDASRRTRFETDVGPITFTLRHLRTVGDSMAPLSLSATTEAGETLAWQGTLELEHLKSAGEFSLSNLSLAKYRPYYQDHVGFVLQKGLLSMKGKYEAEFTAGMPQIRLRDGSMALGGIEMTARDAQGPRIAVNDVTMTGIQGDLARREGAIGHILIAGGRIVANRTPEGTLDLTGLFTAAPVATPPPTSTPSASAGATSSHRGGEPASKPWSFTVNKAEVAQVAVELTDHSIPKPAVLAISGLSATVGPMKSQALNESSAIEMKFGVDGGGEVSLKGTLALQPIGGKVVLTLTQLPLQIANPYLASSLPLQIEKGTATLTGDVTLVDGGLNFAGQTHLDDFSMADNATRSPVAGWSSLSIDGIQASSKPLKADIATINWHGLTVHTVVEKDGRLNLTAFGGRRETPPAPAETTSPSQATSVESPLASAPATAQPAPHPSSGSKPLPPVTVGRIAFEKARFTFRDNSVQPAVESELSSFSGTIEGLSSTNLGRGDLQLNGVVNETAAVAITGKLNPLGTPRSADVKLDFKDIELSPLAPYVAKYAGYAFERGALTLAIEFKLNNRTIDSSEVITLDQFTLGEKNDSPDALKVPLTLAIALLKDRSGRMVIDVPIQGSLDDPQFRIGRVVMRVIGNLLAKAATSPFALLGSMFGGGGDDLAFQAFAPGDVSPLKSEANKLATVTKALSNRPGLRLDLAGSYDPVSDRGALQHAELERQIQARVMEERQNSSASAPPVSNAGDGTMTDDERLHALSSLHAAAFPELAPTVPPPPEPADVPPPQPAGGHSGFFKRLGRLFSAGVTATPPAATTAAPQETYPPPPAAPALSAAEMTAQLIGKILIEDEALRSLANLRAQHIRIQLLQSTDIAPERILIVAPVSTGSRVELRLK